MIVLQEKFQKEEIPSSQGMNGFGLSEEGQGGCSVVEATRGSEDNGRGREWSPNRDTMRTKDGKQQAVVIITLSIQLAFSEPLMHE